MKFVESNIKEDLELIKKVFDKYGIRVFLVYAAALQLLNNTLIPNDAIGFDTDRFTQKFQ